MGGFNNLGGGGAPVTGGGFPTPTTPVTGGGYPPISLQPTRGSNYKPTPAQPQSPAWMPKAPITQGVK